MICHKVKQKWYAIKTERKNNKGCQREIIAQNEKQKWEIENKPQHKKHLHIKQHQKEESSKKNDNSVHLFTCLFNWLPTSLIDIEKAHTVNNY